MDLPNDKVIMHFSYCKVTILLLFLNAIQLFISSIPTCLSRECNSVGVFEKGILVLVPPPTPRFALSANKDCLVGENPTCSVPEIL